MRSSNLSTFPSYYYKLGHLNNVSYTVYGSTVATDQSLLEAELTIRFKHPKMLLTYYNKLIFFFQLHASTRNHYDPIADYPHLELKQSGTIPVEMFSSTAKSQIADKLVSIGCLSFIKAVKKMVLYNLSMAEKVRLFGNYAIVSINEPHYSIVYIEPGLMLNGDLVVSAVFKDLADLFDSSILDVHSLSSTYSRPHDFNYAIYLLPSGVRCHLFDPTDVQSNFSTRANESNEKMLHLIELITGINVFPKVPEPVWWVRLTPNLNHLNNQTSPISDFIHSVDNRKFILWPWKLCVLQLGRYEMRSARESQSPHTQKIHNPLSLMSSLMDFNISKHQAASASKADKSPPSDTKNQTREKDVDIDPQKKEDTLELASNSFAPELHVSRNATPGNIESLSFFDLTRPMEQESTNGEEPIKFDEALVTTEQAESDDMDIDDLFGDDDDDANDKPETPPQIVLQLQPAITSAESFNENPDKERNVVDEERPLLNPKSRIEQFKKLASTEISADQASFVDISKDDMVMSVDYVDPGAPLPIMPTPLFTSNMPSTATNNGVSEETSATEERPNLVTKAVSRSIFSPIVFNPLIKNSIDKKYGKGGKFYVEKEICNIAEPSIASRLRATSVNGLDPIVLVHKTKRNYALEADTPLHEASLSSDAIATDSSEESDADEQVMVADVQLPPRDSSLAAHPLGVIMDIQDNGHRGLVLEEEQQETTTSDHKSANDQVSRAHDGSIGESVGIIPYSIGSNEHNSTLNTPNIFASRMSQLKASSPFSMVEFPNNQTTVDGDLFQGRANIVPGQSPFSQLQPSPERMPFPGELNDSPEKTAQESSKPVDAGKRSAESANYLPLILRSINVNSIPQRFLLKSSFSSPRETFDINAVEKDDDWDLAANYLMSVSLHKIDDLLCFLVPHLVCDMKLNDCKSTFGFIVAGKSAAECMELEAAAQNSLKLQPDLVLTLMMMQVFPNCYRVPIVELLSNCSPGESESASNDLLDFLNKISHFDQDLEYDPHKVIEASEWDCIEVLEENETALAAYKSAIDYIMKSTAIEEDVAFEMPVPKARVLKSDQILNLNPAGFDYWNYLGLNPLGPPKNFQIITIAEKLPERSSILGSFLNALTHHYRASKLGEITKVNLPSVDGSLEVDDGILLIGQGDDLEPSELLRQTNSKLALLVELLRLVAIQKSGSIEFDQPLLLLLVSSNGELASALLVSKLLRNFKRLLSEQQLPLLNVFAKVVPKSLFIKQQGGRVQTRNLSNYKWAKLALNIYNQCPEEISSARTTKRLYSQLVKDTPSKISFKFVNSSQRDNEYVNDLFLHLAYERSADRNWLAAAWSDQFGSAPLTKAWLCQYNTSSVPSRDDSYSQPRATTGSYDMASICDQMWRISSDIFSDLSSDQQASSRPCGDKKFLVLTRVNGIIPDEELVHWKRLSLKYKDISLIVLSVSNLPKVLNATPSVDERQPKKDYSTSPNQESRSPREDTSKNTGSDYSDLEHKTQSNRCSPMTAGLAFMASPSTGICLQSPQQYLNFAGNMWSPREILGTPPPKIEDTSALQNSEFVLSDPETDLVGVIPRLPLPLFSSPSRLSMKVGCLLKEMTQIDNATEVLVYELNLLSCSNYWNLDVLMKLLLKHYSRMIALRPILGLNEINGPMLTDHRDVLESMVPWHVAAVSRVLEYLVHVRVDE